MKQLMFALVLLITASCGKEESTAVRAYLHNQTEHRIQILFFNGGVVAPTDTIILAPGDEFKFAEHNERGLGGHLGFLSDYLGKITNDDSMLVVFGGQHPVAHYVNLPVDRSAKYYDYQSLRNLANYLSYEYTHEAVSKHSARETYVYAFVDFDYQFAAQ